MRSTRSSRMRLLASAGVVAAIAAVAGATTGGCNTDRGPPPAPLPNYAALSEEDLKARAAHADHEAEYELGRRAYQRHETEAVQWMCRAATSRHRTAQYSLGLMYEPGHPAALVSPSYPRAYMWLSLAAANGQSEAIEEKDRIAGLMSPEQIEEARALIASGSGGSCGAMPSS